jgi:hypothetical protein
MRRVSAGGRRGSRATRKERDRAVAVAPLGSRRIVKAIRETRVPFTYLLKGAGTAGQRFLLEEGREERSLTP